jgi:DNA-binding protein HU-beta
LLEKLSTLIARRDILPTTDFHWAFDPIEGETMAAKRMTQSQIVRTLAEKCQVSNKAAREFLQNLTNTAISEVKKNGIFVVPGLGRLVRADRKARVGRNPATGEAINIPAKRVVKFRVSKAAKDAIMPLKAKKAVAG